MKAIIQRVSHADVVIENQLKGSISQGFLVLLGVGKGDTASEADLMADKIANLRIFCDADDKMNLSLLDVNGEALVISNFTLYADTRHGRRPSFFDAASPEIANDLYEHFCVALRNKGVAKVETGEFGADMKVSLLNDGPVTIILNTDDWKKTK